MFRSQHEPEEVEVFRVVNVAEHPDLRAPALSGALHQLDDGESVEVPFIYHDPNARLFVLVIPAGARGRELSERAKLLDELMKTQDDAVPAYVRHFAVVYGHRGLSRHLEEAQTMEVDVNELEPLDGAPAVADFYPALGGLIPDAASLDYADTELTPLIEGERLWVFVRVGDGDTGAFAESSSDLLIQLKLVEQVPVCVLALVDHRAGSVRRAYLNPSRSVDAPVLELLRRDFRAMVVVFDEAQHLLRTFELEAPRAGNAKLILARTEHAPACSKAGWAKAVAACRLAPPPSAAGEHPFIMREGAADAGEALRSLRELEAWSVPARVDEALLTLSVPKSMFELARRRIASDALRFGLGMSDPLLLQAVHFGLARDSKSLVAALCERFAEIVPSASEHGLDPAEVRDNLSLLERLSALHGTSTGGDLSCTMEHSG